MRFEVPKVPVGELHRRLGYSLPLDYPAQSATKPLTQWVMEDDDSPILRYIYRNHRPRRHLEFGTWEGTGTTYVLEECDATVWTINLYEGELTAEGRWAYASMGGNRRARLNRLLASLLRRGPALRRIFGGLQRQQLAYKQTDARDSIGHFYLERGLGHRVCQIFADSLKWDTSNYPDGFFDSCLIDGGHQYDVVRSDTSKAMRLVRSGGIILWHDFCPDPAVLTQCSSPRDVVKYIQDDWASLTEQMRLLFWVQPSWILLGVRR